MSELDNGTNSALTRGELLRVTSQIRAWDRNTVAFDAAIQQIHTHDAAQRHALARLVAWAKKGASRD